MSEWYADFLNTAQFSYNIESGVEIFSSSGQFLDAPSAVSVPAAAWLFGSALLGQFGITRRVKN